MELIEKERLAMTGDMGIKACAIRTHAGRLLTPYGTQKEFTKAAGVGYTTYNNAEKGLSFPNRDVMKFLFRGYRLNFDFQMNGDFSGLPADIHDQLFAKLAIAHSEWDQKQG